MAEKSPLSVLDFLGRGNSVTRRKGPAGTQGEAFHRDHSGLRGGENGYNGGFILTEETILPKMSDHAPSQHFRRKGKGGANCPSSEDPLDDSKVLMATSAALIRRTPSVMSPTLFAFEDHFSFETVIGRSPLSEVYRARHRRTGELFAVKRSVRKFRSKADRDRSLHEIQAVASLPSHPNVVTLHRAWQQNGHFYIQMDLAENGSLGSILQQEKQEGRLFAENVVWQVLWEAAQGLSFLHAHDVIVMDIKPDNVFCNRNGTFQIGDFGLAVVGSTAPDWEEGDGDYLAPELLNDDTPSPAADIYSLGATIYECATGQKLPRSRQGQLLLPGRLPALQHLVQSMLSYDASGRPSAQELVAQVASLPLPFRLSTQASSSQQEPSLPMIPGLFPQEAYNTPAHQMLHRRKLPSGTGCSSVTATCSSGAVPQHRRLSLAQLPSLTLPDAPSPSAVSTPVMCGMGWRRNQSSSDMSHDAADFGSPGPPLTQQRLSVSSPIPISPFSNAGDNVFSTPVLTRRPSTAATHSFTGSTAFVYQSRWARECTFDRSEAAAQVRPFRLDQADDMQGSPSFQLDEDLPGSCAEDSPCCAEVLCLDSDVPFYSAAAEYATPGNAQIYRDCSMGLYDDDIPLDRETTDSSRLLQQDSSFARLSLSGEKADRACMSSQAAQSQDPQPIPSPFASQQLQCPGAEGGQQWTTLTPQIKVLSLSRIDTLKEKKSHPFVCAC